MIPSSPRPPNIQIEKTLDGVIVYRRPPGPRHAFRHDSFDDRFAANGPLFALLFLALLGAVVGGQTFGLYGFMGVTSLGTVIALAAAALKRKRANQYTELIRLTPQQVIFPDSRAVLSEITVIHLVIERGRFRIERRDGPPLVVLRGLEYRELLWLRELMEFHVTHRKLRLGEAAEKPAIVPEAIEALRRRT